jgi:virginiamycin A acetyltransferase
LKGSSLRKINQARQVLYQRWIARSGATLGQGVYIAPGSRFSAPVTIGDHSRFNGPVRMTGRAPIRVGRYVAAGSEVLMVSSNHDTRNANMQLALHVALDPGGTLKRSEPISVLDGVWIGHRAILLSGVTVGHGAVIGAGSVVARDIPAFAIVAGSPARMIRMRFSDEMVAFLLDLAWWDWDRQRVERNAELLTADLTALSLESVERLVRD